MKTNELAGAALDFAVAKCEGGTGFFYDSIATCWITINGKDRAISKGWAQSFTPSTDWSQGGPIIERENITWTGQSSVICKYLGNNKWTHFEEFGPTILIAAMRCYVASKLGENVDIPKELLK